MNIAVFASGGGSNFKAILNKIKSNELKNAEIKLVISNNSKCGAIRTANENNIHTIHLSSKTHPDNKNLEEVMLKLLQENNIELIVLAGYMKLLPDIVVRAFPGRILNIHPALLPQFGGKGMYGKKVHEAVLASGATVSGVTVHYVNKKYDEGQIIKQVKVPVKGNDTVNSLADRVLVEEHNLYWRVIDHIINNTPL